MKIICTVQDTAVPGWSPWSTFGPCSLDCKKERQRYCFSDNPAVDCPGNHPYNVETETVVCNNTECYGELDFTFDLIRFERKRTCKRG